LPGAWSHVTRSQARSDGRLGQPAVDLIHLSRRVWDVAQLPPLHAEPDHCAHRKLDECVQRDLCRSFWSPRAELIAHQIGQELV
jgi:hypothetical protein